MSSFYIWRILPVFVGNKDEIYYNAANFFSAFGKTQILASRLPLTGRSVLLLYKPYLRDKQWHHSCTRLFVCNGLVWCRAMIENSNPS